MGKLIKAECLKLLRLRSYRLILVCAAVVGVMIGYLSLNVPDYELAGEYSLKNGYNIYMSALINIEIFMFFFLVFAVLFICNEFSNRNFGISLFNGCSRWRVLLAKSIVYLAGGIPVFLTIPLMAGITGTINIGFGDVNMLMWIVLIQKTLLAGLGNLSMGALCFLLAILIKDASGTICAGIILLKAVDISKELFGVVNLEKLTFQYQMRSLLQLDSFWMFIAVTVSTLVISLGVSTVVFQKTELK